MERGEGEGKKIGDSKEGWRSSVTRGHDRNRNSVHGRGRGGNGPFTRVYMRRHWNIGFATDAHHIRGKIFQRLSTSARVHRPMRPNVLCHRIFTLVKRTPQVYFLSTDLLFRFSSFFFSSILSRRNSKLVLFSTISISISPTNNEEKWESFELEIENAWKRKNLDSIDG